MKTSTVLFLLPLAVAANVTVFAFSRINHEGFSIWQWCLAVLAAALLALLVGALFNFAVFAPAYWLLGKLHFKTSETQASHEHRR